MHKNLLYTNEMNSEELLLTVVKNVILNFTQIEGMADALEKNAGLYYRKRRNAIKGQNWKTIAQCLIAILLYCQIREEEMDLLRAEFVSEFSKVMNRDLVKVVSNDKRELKGCCKQV